ncbi:MAG: ATP-binding protein, partial [Psychrosphaera sp.]|nr:ATP-binding protein [Psychrosphaera sp.]
QITQSFEHSAFAILNAIEEQKQQQVLTALLALKQTGDFDFNFNFNFENIEQILKPLIGVTHQIRLMHQIHHHRLKTQAEQFAQTNRVRIVLLVFALAALGIYGVITLVRRVQLNLTDLHNIQQRLQQSEKRLLEAEHVSRASYIDWDPVNDQTQWSHETYVLHDISTDTPPSMSAILAVIEPQDIAKVTKTLDQLLLGKQDIHFEYRVRRSDQALAYFKAKAKVELDDNQQVVRVLLSVLEITEQKLIDLELRQYRDHLEELVEQRSKKLIDAQQELLRSERLATLGQLTATVSHELRNPLGAMRPSLYILDKNADKQNPQVNDALARLDRNIDRCDNIIDELLDFTRITTLNCRPFLLDQWLEGVIKDQEIPATVVLATQFNLKRVTVNFDDQRLRRAVINIVQNSFDALQPEQIRTSNDSSSKNLAANSSAQRQLKVSTRVYGNRFEILVNDNGKGISTTVMEKVFEPLFSTKSFGVGLGMPTVKHIMEQHDGGVEITSQINKGTTVTLWIPGKNQVTTNKGATV